MGGSSSWSSSMIQICATLQLKRMILPATLDDKTPSSYESTKNVMSFQWFSPNRTKRNTDKCHLWLLVKKLLRIFKI